MAKLAELSPERGNYMIGFKRQADGAFKIGLNETQVGLAVPECIQMIGG